jgi:alcohol dehydrogenase, propanol-preferring
MKSVQRVDGTIEVRESERPIPGPNQALLRMSTSGVCHSDLHLARGDWKFATGNGPLGHEGIGVVEALGPGAEECVSIADRVILGLGGTGGEYWCGRCRYCIAGEPRHCANSVGIIGTFAEYFTVWAPSLVVLPDSVSDLEAPLACGGLTAYGAVKKLTQHGIIPGSTVAIVGAAGGLGHYAVQLAAAFGYRVIAIDVGDDRLAFATELGAEVAIEANDARQRVANEFGGVDAAIVFTANIAGYQLGFDLLGKKSLFIAVGLPATSQGPFEVDPFLLFYKDPTIIFSAVGTVQDMRELVDLAARGIVKTHVSRTGGLEELPTIFDELEASAYLGRAVITITD